MGYRSMWAVEFDDNREKATRDDVEPHRTGLAM
jgi:hypothetical protein